MAAPWQSQVIVAQHEYPGYSSSSTTETGSPFAAQRQETSEPGLTAWLSILCLTNKGHGGGDP